MSERPERIARATDAVTTIAAYGAGAVLIGLMQADPNPDAVYELGAGALTKLTDVAYSEDHCFPGPGWAEASQAEVEPL